jgi:phage terminase small subunit
MMAAKKEEELLFQSAKEFVIDQQQASVSMLQRRLRIGYSTAARIIDRLENEGIIGAYQGSKPREVLVSEYIKPKKPTNGKETKKKVEKESNALDEYGLRPKQRRFCDYYIELGNITQAAIRAGYSQKTARQTGQENMTKPVIKKYIDERMKEIQSKKIADQEEILALLTSIARGEVEEEVLMGVGMGEQTKTHIEVSAKDRIKAAELLGKRYAMWTDKLDLSGDLSMKIEVDYGDDEE